ncbi:MAG: hypothetical protein AB8G05_24010 [Oligoflexales bacterium]
MQSHSLLMQSIPSLIIAFGTGINLLLFLRASYKQKHFEQRNMRFKLLNEMHNSILKALVSKNRFDTISMYKSLRKLSCLGNKRQIDLATKCISFYNNGRNHFDYIKGENFLVDLLSQIENDISVNIGI